MAPKTREYLGRLCYKDSDELALVHPIVWFREDKAGGWVRLGNLFNINNLVLHQGSLAPTKAIDAKESVKELIKACIQEGADPTLSIDKPLTFSALIKVLEEKGLFKPLASPLNTSLTPAHMATAVETALSDKHRAEVKNFILKEKRMEIDPNIHQSNQDIVINIDPNLSVDLTDVQFIVETTEAPHPLVNEESVDNANTSEEALAALAVEHEKALDSVKLLTNELNISRAKVLQLENQIGSEHGSLISDMRIMISEILAQKFQLLELDFASKVGSEVRSEIARQTSSLMSEVSVLTAIKSLSEATHSNVRAVSDFLTEVSEGSSMANQEITAQLKAVHDDSKLCREVVPRIEAQIASNTAMLKELKDVRPPSAAFQTPAKSEQALPLTPSSTPVVKQCSECGSFTHLKRNCPKADFCARCLQTSHKSWQCYSIKQAVVCTQCQSNGLGDLAYGHYRKVHYESNRAKREIIMKTLPSSCFPEWDPKRKSPSS